MVVTGLGGMGRKVRVILLSECGIHVARSSSGFVVALWLVSFGFWFVASTFAGGNVGGRCLPKLDSSSVFLRPRCRSWLADRRATVGKLSSLTSLRSWEDLFSRLRGCIQPIGC